MAFGDIPFVGNKEEKIRGNGKVSLPNFTDAEVNDDIFIELSLSNNELFLKLYSYETFIAIKNLYIESKQNAINLQDYKMKFKLLRNYLSRIESRKVDESKRIQLGKAVLEQLNWSKNDTIEFTGKDNILILKKK